MSQTPTGGRLEPGQQCVDGAETGGPDEFQAQKRSADGDADDARDDDVDDAPAESSRVGPTVESDEVVVACTVVPFRR